MKCCYEWQAGNPKLQIWVTDLRDELHKIGCNTTEIYVVIKTKCSDIEETDTYYHRK
jgi:hypothetical protein